MKKAIVPLIIVLVVILGIGAYAMRGMAQSASAPTNEKIASVAKGDLTQTVIETGTIDATKTVELKSRVSGRLKSLLVDEGDVVGQGQLVAVIDPQETELKVRQDAAQLSGARSAVDKARLEIVQRRETAAAALLQAKVRVSQLELEMKTQPRLTQAAIDEAQTAYNSAIQDKARLISSTQPNQRTASLSAVDEAQANMDQAQREYDRQNELGGKGYVSGRAVDESKLAVDLAKVRLRSAKDNLSRIDTQFRTEVAQANETIRQAEAALRRAKANAFQDVTKREEYRSAVADLKRAEATMMDPEIMERGQRQTEATVAQLAAIVDDSQRQLRETSVRSPIAGVVTKKLLEVGELATGLSAFTAGTPIVRIEDRRSMRVMVDMNEIDMAKLKVAMPVQIDVDAITDRSYNGVVSKIAPSSKQSITGQSTDAVVRYEVEIKITDADERLRSGMSAKCRINVASRIAALTLPIEYVTRDGRQASVKLVTSAPKAPKTTTEIRKVVLGMQTGATVEIVSGLKEGDRVLKPEFTGPQRKGMMSNGQD